MQYLLPFFDNNFNFYGCNLIGYFHNSITKNLIILLIMPLAILLIL